MTRRPSTALLQTKLGPLAPSSNTDYERECLAWRKLAYRLGWITAPHYGHGDHGWLVHVNGLGSSGEGETLETALLDIDHKLEIRK